MPVCDVCGEDDYYEDDGNFFCNVCNTQSQSMAVMELDDASFGISQKPDGFAQEIRREKKRKGQAEYEAGRPWTRYEAYQLILQGQADALIAHGAHPSVKEAVQRLYFSYLSKLEVAFVGEKKTRLIPKGLEKSEHTGWHRELHRGGMDEPEINPKAMKRKMLKYTFRTGKADRTEERERLAAALEGEEFYEGDNPLDENNEEELDRESDLDLPLPQDSEEGSDDDDDGEEEQEEDKDWNTAKKKSAGKIKHSTPKAKPTTKAKPTPKSKSQRLGKQGVLYSIQYMSLRKTLSFLYSGCLFASPWITVSDILRWVSDGSLPYLETSHLLHWDMKLSAYDQHLFRPSLVTSELLRLDAGTLLRFLDVLQLPEFLVEDIAIKYTLSLDLPEALVPCVISVVKKCPVECSPRLQKNASWRKSLPNIDALCAAYILVALKAIFGLDDERERLLSEYTKRVQKKVDVPLFDWQEWQWHASRKFLVGSGSVSATLGQGSGEGDSVEALCQAFESAQYRDQNYSHQKLYHKRKKSKAAPFKQENREMLKRPASLLEDRWKNRDATAARIRAEEDDAHTSDSDSMSQEKQSVHFRARSIQHLLQAERFLQTHLGEEKASETSLDFSQTLVTSAADFSMSEAITSTPVCGREHSSSSSNSGSDSPTSARRKKDKTKVKKKKRLKKDRELGKKCSVESESQNNCFENGEPACEAADGVSSRTEEGGHCEDAVPHLADMQCTVSGDYWVLPQQRGQDAYSPSRDNPWWKHQSCSYKWLLRVLSTLVHCPLTDIQRMVYEVEQGLLDRGDDLT